MSDRLSPEAARPTQRGVIYAIAPSYTAAPRALTLTREPAEPLSFI